MLGGNRELRGINRKNPCRYGRRPIVAGSRICCFGAPDTGSAKYANRQNYDQQKSVETEDPRKRNVAASWVSCDSSIADDWPG